MKQTSNGAKVLRPVLNGGSPRAPLVQDSPVHRRHVRVEGYDGLDIFGCYIEPPDRILGAMPLEHFVWSTGSD